MSKLLSPVDLKFNVEKDRSLRIPCSRVERVTSWYFKTKGYSKLWLISEIHADFNINLSPHTSIRQADEE